MRVLHWFRSDLRLEDNAALNAATACADQLVPVFVFDPHLCAAHRCGAARLRFLLDSVERLAADLAAHGCPLVVRRGEPAVEVPKLLRQAGAELLTFNRDYGPYAQRRDDTVRKLAERAGVRVRDYKDRVIFESAEVRTRSGAPFLVYTPFRRAWLNRWENEPQQTTRRPRPLPPVSGIETGRLPTAAELGAGDECHRVPTGGAAAARRRLDAFIDHTMFDYRRGRDLPAIDGTSRLSPHLHFGTVSVRTCIELARAATRERRGQLEGFRRWRDELIWREFYHALLAEHPRVLREPFRREYSAIRWDDDEASFTAWREGQTGYPLVDAGMRQLAATGWMHNRVRMVAASFLVKDLLIDWRRGERFFLQRLVDGDPAANNGGWQWVASTGTDSQPYFRIFNPIAQGERFDPDGRYVRRFVPELRNLPDRFVHRPWEAPSPPTAYPPPIVNHAERRRLAIERFAEARRRRFSV